MSLSVSIDLATTPGTIIATAVSTARVVGVSVSAAGETATGSATFPIAFSDTGKRTWTKKSDDGSTAVYTAPA